MDTSTWEQRKFSDLSDRLSIQSSDPDLPQVEYEDIISGMGMLNKDLRDKEGGKTGIKFYAGDVLYGKLRPYLMNWLYPQFNGVAVGDFWILRATECDSSFLYRLVQTDSFQRLANVSSGSKMPRADWNLISQSFFVVPVDHAEQKAIAKSLAELDDLITLHQRTCPIFYFCAHGSRTNFASTFKDSFGYYATRAPSRRCLCRHWCPLQVSSASQRAPPFAALLPPARQQARRVPGRTS